MAGATVPFISDRQHRRTRRTREGRASGDPCGSRRIVPGVESMAGLAPELDGFAVPAAGPTVSGAGRLFQAGERERYAVFRHGQTMGQVPGMAELDSPRVGSRHVAGRSEPGVLGPVCAEPRHVPVRFRHPAGGLVAVILQVPVTRRARRVVHRQERNVPTAVIAVALGTRGDVLRELARVVAWSGMAGPAGIVTGMRAAPQGRRPPRSVDWREWDVAGLAVGLPHRVRPGQRPFRGQPALLEEPHACVPSPTPDGGGCDPRQGEQQGQ